MFKIWTFSGESSRLVSSPLEIQCLQKLDCTRQIRNAEIFRNRLSQQSNLSFTFVIKKKIRAQQINLRSQN